MMLLEHHVTAGDLPVGGGIKEKPPRTCRVEADKNASFGHWTQFPPCLPSLGGVEKDVASAPPHSEAAKVGFGLVPCLVRCAAPKKPMRQQVVEKGGVLNCIAPEGLGSPTVEEQQLGEPSHLFVPGLRHPVLLWAVGVAEGTPHPLSLEVRQQYSVEELPPPIRVEVL